jgi:hypothetical protein
MSPIYDKWGMSGFEPRELAMTNSALLTQPPIPLVVKSAVLNPDLAFTKDVCMLNITNKLFRIETNYLYCTLELSSCVLEE